MAHEPVQAKPDLGPIPAARPRRGKQPIKPHPGGGPSGLTTASSPASQKDKTRQTHRSEDTEHISWLQSVAPSGSELKQPLFKDADIRDTGGIWTLPAHCRHPATTASPLVGRWCGWSPRRRGRGEPGWPVGWVARAFVALSLLLHVVTVFHNKKQAEARPCTWQGWPSSAPLDSLPCSHLKVTVGRSREVAHNTQLRATWLMEGTDLASTAGSTGRQTGRRDYGGSAVSLQVRSEPGGTPGERV